MKAFWKVVVAEAVKQHKNYFHNKTIYISLFVWPFLSFLTAYYGYRSFDIDQSMVSYLTADNLILYLLLGYMCMSYFRSLVQSAWRFSYERISGTLETIFLSPADRFGMVLGNAVSSVFESVIVMFVFSILILFLHQSQIRMQLISGLIVFFLLNILAILWGTFLNACFLYSRDNGFLFTILEEPMEVFSGVKVPISLYPTWAKVIGAIFPLTYVLEAVRKVVLNGAKISSLSGFFTASILLIILLGGSTLVILKIVERHARKTGSLTLF